MAVAFTSVTQTIVIDNAQVSMYYEVNTTTNNYVTLVAYVTVAGPYTGDIAVSGRVAVGSSSNSDYPNPRAFSISLTKSGTGQASTSKAFTFYEPTHGSIVTYMCDDLAESYGPLVTLVGVDNDNFNSPLAKTGTAYYSAPPSSSTGPTWANVYERSSWITILQPNGTVATSSNPAVVAPDVLFTVRWGGGSLVGTGKYHVNVQCITSGGGGPWNYDVTNEYMDDSFGTARAGYTYKYTISVTNGSGSATTYVRVVANTHQLTVTQNKSSYGSVSGGGAFSNGTSVTVRATNNTGYRFIKW